MSGQAIAADRRRATAASPDDGTAAGRASHPVAYRSLPALYARLAGATVRSQLQYRWSFALYALGVFCANGFEFLALLVLFGQAPSLGGWSAPEVALLWGMSTMSFAVAEAFGGGFEKLHMVVRAGEFDRVLARPLPVFFQVMTSQVEAHRAGRLAQGMVAVAFAVTEGSLPTWGAGEVARLLGAVLSGAVIFFATFVIGGAWSFVTVDGSEVVNAFTYGGTTLACSPLDLFAAPVRRAATWVFPLAFVNYVPALALLGRPDAAGILPAGIDPSGPLAVLLVPAVALAFLGVASLAWRAGLRRYQGAGS
jgi:ABC-2 type transport system permease protein